MTTNQPDVTIFTEQFQNEAYVERLKASISKFTNYPNWKFEIVNNYPENKPLSVIWNEQTQKTKSEFICHLDSDTIVEKNWLSGFMRSILSDEKIGLLGPITNNPVSPQGQQKREPGLIDWPGVSGFAFLLRKKA